MSKYSTPQFHFIVECGSEKMGFTEISGLHDDIKQDEYRYVPGKENKNLSKFSMQKFIGITMKRGVSYGNNEFYKWLIATADKNIDKKDLTISLLNENHEPVMKWQVKQAWPVKIEATSLRADGNEVAIESIELVHEGLTTEPI